MADKSVEQLNREVLEAQLETAKISLEKTRDENNDYRRRKEVAARVNANRQRQFAHDRANLRNLQRTVCAHAAGGDGESNPLEGGGKFSFSVLHITIMPDGVTELIQCPRCRVMLYGHKLAPKQEAKLRAKAEVAERKEGFESDPDWLKYDDYIWWKELRDQYKRDGLGKKAITRGPTFSFTDGNGVPFTPDIGGYSTSGGGGR